MTDFLKLKSAHFSVEPGDLFETKIVRGMSLSAVYAYDPQEDDVVLNSYGHSYKTEGVTVSDVFLALKKFEPTPEKDFHCPAWVFYNAQKNLYFIIESYKIFKFFKKIDVNKDE